MQSKEDLPNWRDQRMAICSYCLKEKSTVSRNMFDGMCADCTDKALNSETVAKQAQKNNELLKSKYN